MSISLFLTRIISWLVMLAGMALLAVGLMEHNNPRHEIHSLSGAVLIGGSLVALAILGTAAPRQPPDEQHYQPSGHEHFDEHD
jgi:hypothetical protein